MTADELDPEIGRVSDEIAARLRRVGIATTPDDSPEDIVRLLDAVEGFERAVEHSGGDLMVDEPIGARRPNEPDDPSFILPSRDAGETVDAFIERVDKARSRIVRAHRR